MSFLNPLLPMVLLVALPAAVRASAPDVVTPESWYHQTSFVRSSDCPGAQVLYRSVRNGYFTLGRVVENMIGDELAEYPSYRFLNLVHKLSGGAAPTLAQWIEGKNQAAAELMPEYQSRQPLCQFGDDSAINTVLGGPQSEKDESYGIAASPDLEYSTQYFWSSSDVILKVVEKIPRAAKAIRMSISGFTKGEYYFPIVIAARDISGAFSKDLFVEKIEDAHGLREIDIKSIAKVEQNSDPSEDGTLVARVVACAAQDCESSAAVLKIPEIREIQTSLDAEKSRGFLFKIVAP